MKNAFDYLPSFVRAAWIERTNALQSDARELAGAVIVAGRLADEAERISFDYFNGSAAKDAAQLRAAILRRDVLALSRQRDAINAKVRRRDLFQMHGLRGFARALLPAFAEG